MPAYLLKITTMRPPGRSRPWLMIWLGLVLILTARSTRAEDNPEGQQIYQSRCVECHGESGEGSDFYPEPLIGDRSVESLARLITKTMPQDDPGTCVGEEAEKVAAYIYDAFYSPVAQARNAPPRIELSRLTVRQYRNAVADLIGSFRSAPEKDQREGLQGQYNKSREPRGRNRAFERVDPEVNFDFGIEGPAEGFDRNRFAIRWEGSVFAPETGEYEFVVRTEHATRLWVNNNDQALIDAWVQSGDDTEHRASIFLLGGRSYPIRLDFSKAKQGVDDSKDQKGEPPKVKASIALEWTIPGQTLALIPRQNLSPGRSPEAFVVASAFPPDDRSLGYERGTRISKAWDEATTEAAIDTADYVAEHLRELAGVKDDAEDREARLRGFCRQFAERAFRHPLNDELANLYVDRQFDEAGGDLDAAAKRVLLLVLKSPRFLYREVNGGLDSYDVASRLAFGLWDSLPDQPLLDAAASDQLKTPEQVAAQADRLARDPRTRAKLHAFLLQWLKADRITDLSKDSKRFPLFDASIATDLRTSLDLFLDDVANSESADFRRLLLADEIYLNGRLAWFYGADLPLNAPFQKVTLEPGQRAGVLTHPYLLAGFAYTATSSPIHRGVFLARGVLGRPLRPPPEAFAPLAPDLHPDLTTRQRVSLQTSPQTCQSCHGMINPLGFTLEHFDAVGRYRTEENGRPIDAEGAYQDREGEAVSFAGARDLASYLAASDEVHDAFVRQLFQYLVKQPIRAYGPEALRDLRTDFATQDFNIRSLMVKIATMAALTPREP